MDGRVDGTGGREGGARPCAGVGVEGEWRVRELRLGL